MGRAQTILTPPLAARFKLWCLVKFTPEGIVLPFLFLRLPSATLLNAPSACWPAVASHVHISCLGQVYLPRGEG